MVRAYTRAYSDLPAVDILNLIHKTAAAMLPLATSFVQLVYFALLIEPTEFRRKKSPCGSVRVRSGPCRVRVVEFNSSPTMCADFVRVGPGPCRVRVVEFSFKSAMVSTSI